MVQWCRVHDTKIEGWHVIRRQVHMAKWLGMWRRLHPHLIVSNPPLEQYPNELDHELYGNSSTPCLNPTSLHGLQK